MSKRDESLMNLLAQADYHKQKSKRIIVIDDNLSFLRFMGEALKPLNVDFELHSDPFTALRSYMQFKPDIMFIDVNMPDLDGISLIKMLNGLKVERTKIYLVSAKGPQSLHFNHYAEFLPKPLSRSQIQDAIGVVGKKVA